MKLDQTIGVPLQRWTERMLTRRRIRQRKNQEKSAAKSQLREWIEALLWAVIFVFLINQFLFQLYEIPTPSMEDTLLVKDRVFVNKMIYGPELYPGGPKILSFNDPVRDEIIVFENPNYISRGPLFDTLNRLVYMMTLSLINLDKDEEGEPRAQLYVKRAVGTAGDVVSFSRGTVMIRPPAFEDALSEEQFREIAGFHQPVKRQIEPASYALFNQAAYTQAYRNSGAPVPDYIEQLSGETSRFIDYYHYSSAYYTMKTRIDPSDLNSQSLAARYRLGFYIPADHVLPLGDNRDNSSDGRYFGPVSFENVLGKTVFRFWPLGRVGVAR
jgi:signal peptidase I